MKKTVTTYARHAAHVDKENEKLNRLGFTEASRYVSIGSNRFLEKTGKVAIVAGGLCIAAGSVGAYLYFGRDSDPAREGARVICDVAIPVAEVLADEPCAVTVKSTATFQSHANPEVGVTDVLTYKIGTDASTAALQNKAGIALKVTIGATVEPDTYAQTEIGIASPDPRSLTIAKYFNSLNDTSLPAVDRETNYQICKNELIVLSNAVRIRAADFENTEFPSAIIKDPTIVHIRTDYEPHTTVSLPVADRKEIVFVDQAGGLIKCDKPGP